MQRCYNFVPRTGQTACFHPTNWVGHAIAAVRGPCSHAGTIIVSDGRVLVQEQVSGGSRLWPLSAHVADGQRITIRDLPDWYDGPEGWQERLEEFAWATWGVWKYSLPKLSRHVAYAVLGGPKADTSWLDAYSDEQLVERLVRQICSERASFNLRRFAHYDPVLGLRDDGTAPRHLYLTPRLVTVCERVAFVGAQA